MTLFFLPDSARPTSRPDTSSGKSRLSSRSATSGRPSMRRWPRSTKPFRRSWRSSRTRLTPSKWSSYLVVWQCSLAASLQCRYRAVGYRSDGFVSAAYQIMARRRRTEEYFLPLCLQYLVLRLLAQSDVHPDTTHRYFHSLQTNDAFCSTTLEVLFIVISPFKLNLAPELFFFWPSASAPTSLYQTLFHTGTSFSSPWAV